MIKTLKIDSTQDGIRVVIRSDSSRGVRDDLIALVGRGNLQSRVLLATVRDAGTMVDTIEAELDVADAASISRVGHWIGNPSDEQRTLINFADLVLAGKGISLS